MKILHCTDLHFRQPWFEWLARNASDYSVCCLSGDFLDQENASPSQVRAQIKWIQDWVRWFPGTLVMCSGSGDAVNNRFENPAWMEELDHEIIFDGGRTVSGRIWFHSLGWTDWIEAGPTDFEVLVTHVGPALTKVAWSKDYCGQGEIDLTYPLKQRGSLVLCGHVHAPLRWWDTCGTSLCLNPGSDFSQSVPNHVIVDFARKQATHVVGNRIQDTIKLKLKLHP